MLGYLVDKLFIEISVECSCRISIGMGWSNLIVAVPEDTAG